MAEDEADVSGNRITVNLSKRGLWALGLITSGTGESKTDAVNDALRLYAMVLQAGPDSQLYIKPRNGDMERIHLL
jgi:hypothetical protein